MAFREERSRVAPLMVVVSKAWQRADRFGDITDELYGRRLDGLGGLVVDLAGRLAARDERADLAGVAG